MQSYSQIREFIEENDVEFIRLAYFDVFGTQKNIAIMSGELERAMKYGISIDGAAIAGFDADIRSDLFLRPDPSTISIVPWRPADGRVCRMFCDIVYPDGTPFERDTRYMLKIAMEEARSRGVEVKFGPEVEFYVFRQDERGRKTDEPIDHAGYMDVDPLDSGENLRRDICYALVEMGITPESSHHEQGPGQMEIDFRYGDPLTAADNTSTFKWAVRSICAADGYAADFSPKPIADKPGSGMHLNISVHRIEGKDRKEDLDAFMAGVLKYIREITLFLNPSEQSYWRFGRMEAPRYIRSVRTQKDRAALSGSAGQSVSGFCPADLCGTGGNEPEYDAAAVNRSKPLQRGSGADERSGTAPGIQAGGDAMRDGERTGETPCAQIVSGGVCL